MVFPARAGSTPPPTAYQNPGLTHLTQINHTYVNGLSNTHQSLLPGAISIVVTACLLTSTNSPNNTAAFPPLCLPQHPLSFSYKQEMGKSALLCRPPPINRHHLPRNITRPLRSQKQHRRSQLPLPPNPPHRHRPGPHRLSPIQNSLRHPRPEHRWRNRT